MAARHPAGAWVQCNRHHHLEKKKSARNPALQSASSLHRDLPGPADPSDGNGTPKRYGSVRLWHNGTSKFGNPREKLKKPKTSAVPHLRFTPSQACVHALQASQVAEALTRRGISAFGFSAPKRRTAHSPNWQSVLSTQETPAPVAIARSSEKPALCACTSACFQLLSA